MDPAALLRQARAEAGLTQRMLTLRADTSRSSLAKYESGAMSPTVRQLSRLLAACGSQIRCQLEPVGADLDAALDAALAGSADPQTDPAKVDALLRMAESLDAGEVCWALDGATALALQGLAVEHHEFAVALVDDDASRRWLRKVWAKGTDRDGFPLAPSWDESNAEVRCYVRRPVYTLVGFLQLRFLDEPSPAIPLAVGGRTLPVLPLLTVERDLPRFADLLARWRERQAGR